MTRKQCKAARALVDLTQEALAERSGITRRTLMKFETGAGNVHPAYVNSIRRALEGAGVEMLDGAAVGVRLREGFAA